MRGIVRDSIVEMFDHKVIYVFVAITFFTMVIILISGAIDTEFKGDLEIGTETTDVMNEVADQVITKVFGFYLSVLVFLGVMASAGLFPRMLEPGRAEFYLSKPVSRQSLYLNRLLGMFVSYWIMICLSGIVVYATLVLVHGGFQLRAAVSLLCAEAVGFFIWLTITSCAGVCFGSHALAIMSAFILWILHTVLSGRDFFKQLIQSDLFSGFIDAFYYIVPKSAEVSDIGDRIALGEPVESWIPLWSSLLFALAAMYIATLVFKRKSY